MEKSGGLKLSKKRIIILLIVIAAAIAAILFFGWYFRQAEYFETHFFEGTVINGDKVSFETAEEVKREIQNDIDQYAFSVISDKQ